jgi:hypothetical protein
MYIGKLDLVCGEICEIEESMCAREDTAGCCGSFHEQQ